MIHATRSESPETTSTTARAAKILHRIGVGLAIDCVAHHWCWSNHELIGPALPASHRLRRVFSSTIRAFFDRGVCLAILVAGNSGPFVVGLIAPLCHPVCWLRSDELNVWEICFNPSRVARDEFHTIRLGMSANQEVREWNPIFHFPSVFL